MEELDFKELLEIFWSKKFIILIATVLFIVAGYIYSKVLITPKYTAKATMVLASTGASDNSESTITATDITLNNNLIATYRELAKSTSVVRKVLENLNITDLSEELLKGRIDVSSETGTQVINISVTDEDPYMATKITNELTKVFSDKVAEIYKIDNISILDSAEMPSTPSNINTMKTITMFGTVGLILSVAVIYIISMLDNTIKSTKDVEKALKVPILAELPQCDFSESLTKRRRN